MVTTRRYWRQRYHVRIHKQNRVNVVDDGLTKQKPILLHHFSGYVVEKRDKKTGEWVRCSDPIRGNEVTLTKLKDGHEYEFRVMAENANGLSEPLVTDKPVLVKNPFSEIESFVLNFIRFSSNYRH